MKFILIDNKDGDLFTREFSTAEEAIKEADKQFSRLTPADKRRRTEFYVLESANPDEDVESHLDGEVIKSYL